MPSQLGLTRQQILAFRRRVGGLDERLPKSPKSLRRAAWAGLQDSMPRAALLSLHARVEGVGPSTWEDPSLAQLWGPRYSTYVVAKRDFALFSLGRLPDNAKGRERAERMAERLHAGLGGARMTDREIGRAIGVGNAMRYAATTGTVVIRWEGARAPVVWTVDAPAIDPADACRELARRHLHVFGPTTADGFARWAGISRRAAANAFASLEGSLAAGPVAARRRVAARGGRAGDARRRDGARSRAPAAERRCLLPARRKRAGAARPARPISGSCSGRLASGRARSLSTARSAEPGDARSTPCGSKPGRACHALRGTPSRPRPAPCRFRASTGRSRWSGAIARSATARAGGRRS